MNKFQVKKSCPLKIKMLRKIFTILLSSILIPDGQLDFGVGVAVAAEVTLAVVAGIAVAAAVAFVVAAASSVVGELSCMVNELVKISKLASLESTIMLSF